MNLIQLSADEAHHFFSFLYAQILARTYGLGVTGIRIDAFFDDQFVVTGDTNFDADPLPRHIKFVGDSTCIINAPILPEVLEANELTLDRPTNAAPLWDMSNIQKIICGPLVLVDPGEFPRFIQAEDIVVELSEEGKIAGASNLSNRRIELTNPNLDPHIKFLGFLASLPPANTLGLECLIDGLHLHEWADQPCIVAQRRECAIEARIAMDQAVSCYAANFAAKAVLTTVPLPTHGMIIDVDLI